MKAITKEQAQEFNAEVLKEKIYAKSKKEAVEKLNNAIKIHWNVLKSGQVIHTQPVQYCIEYHRLMMELIEEYKVNGFAVNWSKGASVMIVQLIAEPKVEQMPAIPEVNTGTIANPVMRVVSDAMPESNDIELASTQGDATTPTATE